MAKAIDIINYPSELLNEREIEYRERCVRIMARFKELRKKYPAMTVTRLFGIIAEEEGISKQSVRVWCLNSGVYKKTRKWVRRNQEGRNQQPSGKMI